MKKLIVANWKMNPSSAKRAVLIASQIEKGISKFTRSEVVIAPPFPFLAPVKKILKYARLGAQDDFWENQGAYTGEVSPAMLKNSGVEYVIIGHSERRRLGETDEAINKKIKATLKAGMKVILCVGESLEIRKKGLAAAKNFVKAQLKKDLKGVLSAIYRLLHVNLIIAYEPIWAISTNKNAKADKPEDSLEMVKFVKSLLIAKPYILNPAVLYGGSVTSKNAKSFLQYKEISGALVGGASLKSGEFKKIIADEF
jgi:triosephosphate isomerase